MRLRRALKCTAGTSPPLCRPLWPAQKRKMNNKRVNKHEKQAAHNKNRTKIKSTTSYLSNASRIILIHTAIFKRKQQENVAQHTLLHTQKKNESTGRLAHPKVRTGTNIIFDQSKVRNFYSQSAPKSAKSSPNTTIKANARS